jgi:hypothetical protein
MLNNIFFEERAVYVIKWKNYVELKRPHTPIRHIRIACWKQATNTDSEYVMFIAFLDGNNRCKNAPRYYNKLTLPVLFYSSSN